MTENKRVYCLYRVSTLGQVDKDDIPMQKQCCREFAERQGWTIVKEFSEKGEIEKLVIELASAQELVDNADRAAKEIKEQYDRILTWADMFEGSTLEGKKMIMWQVVEKVRIYRDYKFVVDLKPTVKEFKALWSKRSTQYTNGAA